MKVSSVESKNQVTRAKRWSLAAVAIALGLLVVASLTREEKSQNTVISVSNALSAQPVKVTLFTTDPSQSGLIWIDRKNPGYDRLSVRQRGGPFQILVPGGERAKITKFCLCGTDDAWTGSVAQVSHGLRTAVALDGGSNGLTVRVDHKTCKQYTVTGGLKPKVKATKNYQTYDKCGLKPWSMKIRNARPTNYPKFLSLTVENHEAKLMRDPGGMPGNSVVSHNALLVDKLGKEFCVCAEKGAPRFIGGITEVLAPKSNGASEKDLILYPSSDTAGNIDLNRVNPANSPQRCAIFDVKKAGKNKGFTLARYGYIC